MSEPKPKWWGPNTPEQNAKARMFWLLVGSVAFLLIAGPLVVGVAIRAWRWMIP